MSKSAYPVLLLGFRRETHVTGARHQRIVAVTGRQQGAISRKQLLAVGVGRQVIADLVAEGALRRRHRGVYTYGETGPYPFTAEAAALLVVPGAAALAGRSAAAVWKLGSAPRVVEVVATSGRGTTHRAIHVTRTNRLTRKDIRIREGLPVTSPAWTLADLARTHSQAAHSRAVDEAFSAGLVTDAQLHELLARRPCTSLRDLVEREQESALTRSRRERRLLKLIREAGLPAPLTNVDLHGFNVDFYWPEHKLVVELDGRSYHSRHFAFERDRRKDQTLRQHGVQPLRVTGDQVADHPLQMVALIARNLS